LEQAAPCLDGLQVAGVGEQLLPVGPHLGVALRGGRPADRAERHAVLALPDRDLLAGDARDPPGDVDGVGRRLEDAVRRGVAVACEQVHGACPSLVRAPTIGATSSVNRPRYTCVAVQPVQLGGRFSRYATTPSRASGWAMRSW